MTVDATAQQIQNGFSLLNSIGTMGLAFIVWCLMTGRLVTRREFDACCERETKQEARMEKLEQRLDRALHIGDRAMDAGDKLAERLPGK